MLLVIATALAIPASSWVWTMRGGGIGGSTPLPGTPVTIRTLFWPSNAKPLLGRIQGNLPIFAMFKLARSRFLLDILMFFAGLLRFHGLGCMSNQQLTTAKRLK
jgi:hypothetical protein